MSLLYRVAQDPPEISEEELTRFMDELENKPDLNKQRIDIMNKVKQALQSIRIHVKENIFDQCSATGGEFYNLDDLASPTIQLKIFVGSIFGVRRVITESRVLRWIIKHLTKRSSCGSCGYCQRIHLPLWHYPTGHVRHLFVTAGRGAALGYRSLCSAHSTHSFLVGGVLQLPIGS
ncbi:hypothetical protein ACLKA7_005525 [Drosophila subpalustris]